MNANKQGLIGGFIQFIVCASGAKIIEGSCIACRKFPCDDIPFIFFSLTVVQETSYFLHHPVSNNAFYVRKLRECGIASKTNLSGQAKDCIYIPTYQR
jgi:hypothetical protein